MRWRRFPRDADGASVNVSFKSGFAVKTTKASFATEEAAQAEAGLLQAYYNRLVKEPLSVASLLDVGVVRRGSRFVLRHTMEIVPGLSLSRLGLPERLRQARSVVGQVCAMATLNGGEKLATALDLHEGNVISGKVVDIYPPLLRGPGDELTGSGPDGTPPLGESIVGYRDAVVARFVGRSFFRSGILDREDIPHTLDTLLPPDTDPAFTARVAEIITYQYSD